LTRPDYGRNTRSEYGAGYGTRSNERCTLGLNVSDKSHVTVYRTYLRFYQWPPRLDQVVLYARMHDRARLWRERPWDVDRRTVRIVCERGSEQAKIETTDDSLP
jgi:hypothetical protein